MPPDDLSYSTHGLVLIRTLMDEVAFSAAGNRITLHKRENRGCTNPSEGIS